jgi:hypothetical protein
VVRACLVAVPVLALGHLLVGAVLPPGAEPALGSNALAWWATARWGVRTLLAIGAALCFVLGPGIALRTYLPPASRWRNPAYLWVPGFGLLVIVGLIVWGLAAFVDPAAISAVLLLPVALGILWRLWSSPVDGVLAGHEAVVLLVLGLVLLIGLGRATWSQVPEGTLYGGEISRTFEADARSDPRISYNTVILVAHGENPLGERGATLYRPYTFFDRGPVAGLAAAPVVLTAGADPPRELAELAQPWMPFDPQGYAAYRIVLMLLGCTVLLGVFGLLTRFLSERAAVAGVLLVALTPFVIHEVYFTWPKLIAASLGLVALVALLERRPLVSGLLFGLGSLAHPGVLLAVPGVLLTWVVLVWRGAGRVCDGDRRYPVANGRRPAVLVHDGVWLALGLAVVVVAWRVITAGRDVGEFENYLFQADGIRPVAFVTWLGDRLRLLGNTLVPLRMFLFDRDSRWVNSFYGRSPGIVQFSFSYFATLPFAVGLVYFPAFLVGLYQFGRRSAALFLAAIVVPLLGFTLYWGASPTGMLREGLQFLVVIALLAAFLGHSFGPGLTAAPHRWDAVVRACVSVRGVEVLFMLLVPTIVTTDWRGPDEFLLTDLVALTAMIGGTIALAVLTWRVFTRPFVCAEVPAGRPVRAQTSAP